MPKRIITGFVDNSSTPYINEPGVTSSDVVMLSPAFSYAGYLAMGLNWDAGQSKWKVSGYASPPYSLYNYLVIQY